MFAFKVYYSNGARERFQKITKVQYANAVITGNEILTHLYPTNVDLHLFSDTKHSVVSPKNIVKIEVSAEQEA